MKAKIAGERGAMALGSILALAVILLAVGLAMSFSGFIQSDISSNQDKASIAFYAAEAGVKDAMQKVARKKNYNTDALLGSKYDLAVGNGSAAITVCNSNIVCPDISSGQTKILSTGMAQNNTKKIKVILNTDAANDGSGKVSIVSWEEMAN